jgi:DNA mismatch repair protein MutS2
MNQHTLDVLEYEKVKEILVSYATSGLGKNLAQKIRPLTDRPRIERLIAETTELKTLLAPDRWLPLGGLHDLAPLLDKLDDGEEILITEEILSIKETLRAGRNIKGFIADAVGKQKSVPFAHLMRLAESIRLYPEIEARIERTFGASGEMHKP